MGAFMSFRFFSCALFFLAAILNAANFDQEVQSYMAQWEVPGLAVAVIQDDVVVFKKGYGVLKLGDKTPVTEKTLFAIGSCTKAFTATAIAMLIDEEKVKWDDAVAKHLKGFQLCDPYLTREVSLRDLLAHRCALDTADILWYGTQIDSKTLVEKMRYLQCKGPFRCHYSYHNLMYLVAGEVVAAVSGKPWSAFIKERIFTPLGMTMTNCSVENLKHLRDVASPHAKVGNAVVAVPWRNLDVIGPAGSINSNVVDMAQWVKFQLAKGKKMLSRERVEEMQVPQMLIPQTPYESSLYPKAHFLTYGLGWFLHDYRGFKVVEHPGSVDGMRALVAMIPEKNLGVVILTNLQATPLTHVLKNKLFDQYLELPEHDWNGDFVKTMKTMKEGYIAAEQKKEQQRVKGTKPSLPLERYVGVYTHELYGDLKVSIKNSRLFLEFLSLYGGLAHWEKDQFQLDIAESIPTQPYKGLAAFSVGAQGKVETVKFAVPQIINASFKKAS